MPGPHTPQSASPFPWRSFGLVWAAIALLLILTSLGRIAGGQFYDPDDFLRLVQVRDLLHGQGWFDLTQYRLNPPGGTPMHWSRLVDLPLAGTILLLRPLLGVHGAETAAAVLVPLLTLGCIVALTMRIASRFFAGEAAVLAGFGTLLVPMTLAQLKPMRIDHHGWQLALVMLAAAAPVLVASPRKAAALAGFAMATGLAISLEMLPLAAGYGAVLALGWLIAPDRGQRFAAYTASLALGLAGLFLATRGPAALTPWCDANAPAHLALFGVAAAGTLAAARFGPAKRWFVLAALAVSGLAALGTFAALAPNCLAAPFSELDPQVYQLWYRNIPEGMPAWSLPRETVLVSAVLVSVALLALIWIVRLSRGAARQFWTEYLLFFLAAGLTGLMVWRSIAFAGALSAVPLGWLIRQFLIWLREDRNARAQGKLPLRYIGVAAALALLGFAANGVGGKVQPASSAAAGKPVATLPDCGLPASAGLLDKLPAQTIFAPLDIAANLLERSHHAVVASNHHRANLAIRDLMQGFMAGPDEARTIMARHGATLVVVCAGMTEPGNYARFAPHGLMAQLLAGHAPAWLEPVDLGAPASLLVYRVVNRP